MNVDPLEISPSSPARPTGHGFALPVPMLTLAALTLATAVLSGLSTVVFLATDDSGLDH